MGRMRALAVLSLVMFVLLIAVNVEQVWADTVNSGNPVIAGQPFSISGVSGGGFGSLYHGSLCDNGGSITAITAVFDPSAGSFTDNFPALPAGPYSFSHENDLSGCVPFSIVPASIPEYPLAVGGTMLPVNQVRVVLPWLMLLALLSTVSVWALVIKRKTRN